MLITLETFRNDSHTKYHNDTKQLVPTKLVLLITMQFQSYYQDSSDLCTDISYNLPKDSSEIIKQIFKHRRLSIIHVQVICFAD